MAIQETGIRKARKQDVFQAPELVLSHEDIQMPKLMKTRSCYVCKKPFHQLHHFYDQMCLDCSELNYTKRFQKAIYLTRWALVTGARVKIGYQIALNLLRSWC